MSRIVILPPGQAVSLNPTQSGFAHGYALFETMLVQDGKLRYWHSHWERLTQSAAKLGFHFSLEMSAVLDAIKCYCREANISDSGIVKCSLVAEGEDSVLYLYGRPQTVYPVSADLLLDSQHPVNEHSVLAGHKTHNYLENLLLLKAARAAQYDDCLRLNTAGHLAETCVANFFFLRDGALCTPSLACGVLPGVIRQAIIELAEAEDLGRAMPVKCGAFTLEDLRQADAVFLTNASVGILPVRSLTSESAKLEWDSLENPLLRDLTNTVQAHGAANAVSLVE